MVNPSGRDIKTPFLTKRANTISSTILTRSLCTRQARREKRAYNVSVIYKLDFFACLAPKCTENIRFLSQRRIVAEFFKLYT